LIVAGIKSKMSGKILHSNGSVRTIFCYYSMSHDHTGVTLENGTLYFVKEITGHDDSWNIKECICEFNDS
jgi:hypothetical protein